MLFFWTLFIKESWKKAQLFSTLIIIRNVNILEWFWRSCDTEDWSNDAENSALITEMNDILQYIHIENTYFKL